MGSVRKASAWLGLVADDDGTEYDDGTYDGGAESTDRPAAGPRERAATPAQHERRIAAVSPESFRDARSIGEFFRDGVPVIMNLTAMEPADAKRVVDFAAGLTFGLRGSIDRVSARVFLLSPSDTEIVTGGNGVRTQDGVFNQS